MGDSTLHSELSPSKRHRWGACPGSIREEAKYPDAPAGNAAADGTRTHTLLERCIRYEMVDKEGVCGAAPFINEVITDEYGTYTVDADRAARVNVAMEYIRSRPNGANAIPERRVYPDGLVGRADLHGTVDVQIPDNLVYEIIDYKDGMAPVEAQDNPQLEQYALGALAALEKHPKSFQMTVIQPKMAMRGMPVVSTFNLSTRGLLDKVAVIKAQADATDDPDAPLVPGESQCKYCRAKGACPALASKVMSEVNVMFSAIPEVADVAHQTANKDPQVMGDDELRQILEAAPLVRQLLDGVEKEVQRRLEAGLPFAGFKLVRGRGSRSWSLPDDEMAKKLTGMGVPKASLYEHKLVSPAKAEKLQWLKAGISIGLSDRQLTRMHTEYVASQPGKPTVAPDGDSREPLNLNAAPLFGVVEAPVEVVAEVVVPVDVPPAMPEWLTIPAWMQ